MADRNLPPSARRLSDARNRGQVVRSQELAVAISLLVALSLIRAVGGQLIGALQQVLVAHLNALPDQDFSGLTLRDRLVEDMLQVGPPLAMLVLGLGLTGVVASVGQTGWLWPSERAFFDLNRFNPLSGLKNMFSLNGLMNLFRSLLKLALVGWIAYGYLRDRALVILGLGQMTSLLGALQRLAELAYDLALRIAVVYLLLGVADYAYQRWSFYRSMNMTREEAREEIKSQEGDPRLKNFIRQQQRRMSRRRMFSNLPQADVVITNPTHFAVALEYRRDEMDAPRVVAKGAALVAQRIREEARRHHVPVVENPPLARSLYRLVEVEASVPPDLYLAVAEVLAYVYRLRAASSAAPSAAVPAARSLPEAA